MSQAVPKRPENSLDFPNFQLISVRPRKKEDLVGQPGTTREDFSGLYRREVQNVHSKQLFVGAKVKCTKEQIFYNIQAPDKQQASDTEGMESYFWDWVRSTAGIKLELKKHFGITEEFIYV